MKALALVSLVFAMAHSSNTWADSGRLAAVGQTIPSAAPAGTPVAIEKPEPFARFNRFALSFGFGFGSASLSRFHEMGQNSMAQSGLSRDDAPESGLQINAEVAFRYYFPYYVMGQVGYSTVYNKASSEVGNFTITSDSLVMEVPILVGGYYYFIERLYVFGAAGPSVFFFPRSYWDVEPGSAPDMKADSGVGFHFLTGADFLVAEHFAVGLELRYRYIKTGDIKELKHEIKILDPKGEPYDLDFSGISLGIVLRIYVI